MKHTTTPSVYQKDIESFASTCMELNFWNRDKNLFVSFIIYELNFLLILNSKDKHNFCVKFYYNLREIQRCYFAFNDTFK